MVKLVYEVKVSDVTLKLTFVGFLLLTLLKRLNSKESKRKQRTSITLYFPVKEITARIITGVDTSKYQRFIPQARPAVT